MLVIELQDTYCRIYAWQALRAGQTLKAQTCVPLERNDQLPSHAGAPPSAIAQKNGQAIRKALKEIEIKPQEAVVVVPKQWVTLRIVTLPSSETAELREMARFEAERHIPFNVERHIVSHHVLETDEIKGSRVIIAALDGPPAWEITATMSVAGIPLHGITVSTIALANALKDSAMWDSETQTTIAQIHVGESATDITILQDSAPIFARSIPLGIDKLLLTLPEESRPELLEMNLQTLQSINLLREDGGFATPGEEAAAPARASLQGWINRLVQEVRRTHDFADREFRCGPLQGLFLSGTGARLGNLKRLLATRLEMEPAELSLEGGRLDVSAQEQDGPLAPSAYALAAGVLGAEPEEGYLSINLLPEAYIRKQRGRQKQRVLMVTAGLALMAIVLVVLYMQQLVSIREQELDEINRLLKQSGRRAREVSYRKAVVRILESRQSEKGSALGILNDISSWQQLLGDRNMRVSVQDFSYEAGKLAKISGQARSHKDLNDFIAQLEQSGHFTDVVIESRPNDPNRYPGGIQLIKYTLNCYLDTSDRRR